MSAITAEIGLDQLDTAQVQAAAVVDVQKLGVYVSGMCPAAG